MVQFRPLPGKEAEFRQELLKIIGATRAESGCLVIRAFESIRESRLFAIDSEWTDEAAFERHTQFPHTAGFVEAAKKLLMHEIQGTEDERNRRRPSQPVFTMFPKPNLRRPKSRRCISGS